MWWVAAGLDGLGSFLLKPCKWLQNAIDSGRDAKDSGPIGKKKIRQENPRDNVLKDFAEFQSNEVDNILVSPTLAQSLAPWLLYS